MVLTFANWRNYTYSGGSGTIDWDHLEGTPRAAVYEALRQALYERINAIGGDASLATDLHALVSSPVELGVDMDYAWRLQTLDQIVWDMSVYAASWAYPWVLPVSGGLPLDSMTWTTCASANVLAAIGDSERVTDVLSATWARQIKSILDLFYLAHWATGSVGLTGVTAHYTNQLFGGLDPDPNNPKIPVLNERIYQSGMSFEDLQAALLIDVWEDVGDTDMSVYHSAYSASARRVSHTIQFPARPISRTAYVYAFLSGDWPEYDNDPSADPTLMHQHATTADAFDVVLGRLRTIEENKSGTTSGWTLVEDFSPGLKLLDLP